MILEQGASGAPRSSSHNIEQVNPISPPNPLLLNAYIASASVKKAPAMWGFGMSKSGTKLLLKISLQVAQVLQQLSELPASQVT